MPLKLREGTELIFAIRQDPKTGALILEQRMRVGSTERPRAKPDICPTEEKLWQRWLEFGDEQLARIGMEKTATTKPRIE